ncbi:MAG: hypothetical protein ABSA07_09450 [Acidimicrobiales bacterium]
MTNGEQPKGVWSVERHVHFGMTRIGPRGDVAAMSSQVSGREEQQSARFQNSINGVKRCVGVFDVFENLDGDDDVIEFDHVVQIASYLDAVRRRKLKAVAFVVQLGVDAVFVQVPNETANPAAEVEDLHSLHPTLVARLLHFRHGTQQPIELNFLNLRQQGIGTREELVLVVHCGVGSVADVVCLVVEGGIVLAWIGHPPVAAFIAPGEGETPTGERGEK